MQPVLFRELCERLECHGVHVGVRDGLRIRTVLAARREWTLDAVKNCLRALLAHGPDQRRCFDREFDRFIVEIATGSPIQTQPLEYLLDVLKSVNEEQPDAVREHIETLDDGRKGESADDQPPLPPEPPDLRERAKKRMRSFRRWPVYCSSVLLLLVTVVVWYLGTLTGNTEFLPSTIAFGTGPLDVERSTVVNLTNHSRWFADEIVEITLAGDDADQFSVDRQAAPRGTIIEPGQSLSLAVAFRPQREGSCQAELRVTLRGEPESLSVSLIGWCQTPSPPSETVPLGPPPEVRFPVYEADVPVITYRMTPLAQSLARSYWLIASACIGLLGFGYLMYIIRLRKRPRVRRIRCRPNEEHERFSAAAVGGPPSPWLRHGQAKRLADVLDFVPTGAGSSQLDIDASVRATVVAGGVPRLHYRPHVRTRPTVIVEDERTNPVHNSSLVDDLCAGLSNTGVSVTRIHFREGFSRLTGESGELISWEDFEALGETHVVLVFSDGTSLRRPEHEALVCRVASWPRSAWIDLCDPELRRQDDLAAIVPLGAYPPTAEGLVAAVREMGAVNAGSFREGDAGAVKMPLLPGRPGTEAYLDGVLGELLLWAADCALFQPCSELLAERLRAEYHSDVPRTGIHRLRGLQGVERSAGCLSFDYATKVALRRIWLARRTDDEKRDVLTFIESSVRASEPKNADPHSMAYRTWDACLTRARLEIAPDEVAERLLEYSRSPLRRYVEVSLAGYTTDARVTGPNRQIPMCSTPDDPRSRQLLACVEENLGIPRTGTCPVPRRNWGILAVLLSACAACGLAALVAMIRPPIADYWHVEAANAREVVLWIKDAHEERFREIGAWGSEKWNRGLPQPGSDLSYRVDVAGTSGETFQMAADEALHVAVDWRKQEKPQILKWIEPGTFLMGSPVGEEGRDDDETQHEVVLTQGYFLGATEVTQGWYQAIMEDNPSDLTEIGPGATVADVSWDEATEFCRKLTQQERAEGRLPDAWEYRLPTEAQWEYACRAGTTTAFAFGDRLEQERANFNAFSDDGFLGPASTGSYLPNRWGLYDMHGNVEEWCADWYGDYPKGQVTNPTGPDEGTNRVFRGGHWFFDEEHCRSANRIGLGFGGGSLIPGFRVTAVQIGGQPRPDQPKPEGRRRGLELVRIEPGEFVMGSPTGEAGRDDDESQHTVRISKPFYFGKYEVTQYQYERVMGENPSEFKNAGPNAPVERVSWEDAVEFCRRLTQNDPWGQLPDGYLYTLPTESQWEYVCRAGSTGPVYQGIYRGEYRIVGENNAPAVDPLAWYGGNSGVAYEDGWDASDLPDKQYAFSSAGTHPVGLKEPNAWRLHGMLGNVWEWCGDWCDDYPTGQVTDPVGPSEGTLRVIRGGAWDGLAQVCRSAGRGGSGPGFRDDNLGFRVAAVQIGERVWESQGKGFLRNSMAVLISSRVAAKGCSQIP